LITVLINLLPVLWTQAEKRAFTIEDLYNINGFMKK